MIGREKMNSKLYNNNKPVSNLIEGRNYLNDLIKFKKSIAMKANIARMGTMVYSSADKPIVGTQALDTCCGILFYDRINKRAVAGHEAPSSTSVINQMLSAISDMTEKNSVWEYSVIAGFRNNEKKDFAKVQLLNKLITSYYNPKVRLIPFKGDPEVKLHHGTLTYEFAFNSSTGQFVTYDLFFEDSGYDYNDIDTRGFLGR